MNRAIAFLAAALCAASALGQAYPTKPVRIIVPAATGGPDIVEKLWREVRTAMQDPGVRQRLAGIGIGIGIGVEPVADSPPDFRKIVAPELKAYAEQVRLAGGKPE